MNGLSDARERAEARERARLSTWGIAASESKGRDREERPDPVRTAFEVDRDRLLASDALRLLAAKTASLPTGGSESLLQWTLRVASAARSLARALALNEDLAEAIALGRRLGAPPFASAGVAAITDLVDSGFRVHEQSLRVVERLAADGRGLNLTWEVRDGIVAGDRRRAPAATREGQVVQVVEAVVARVAAHRGATVPEVGEDPQATLLGAAAEASYDRPEVVLGDHGERLLATLGQPGGPAGDADADRAVHVVASLLVFEQQRRGDDDPRPVVDRICAWSDGAALAAYRARFEPELGDG